jgi:hypothetical protein
VTVNGPNVIQSYLSITQELGLIEYLLRGVHRENETTLIEQEAGAKLMLPPGIVRVELSIMFLLPHRTDDNEISDWDGLSVDGDRGQIRSWRDRKVFQDVRHR